MLAVRGPRPHDRPDATAARCALPAGQQPHARAPAMRQRGRHQAKHADYGIDNRQVLLASPLPGVQQPLLTLPGRRTYPAGPRCHLHIVAAASLAPRTWHRASRVGRPRARKNAAAQSVSKARPARLVCPTAPSASPCEGKLAVQASPSWLCVKRHCSTPQSPACRLRPHPAIRRHGRCEAVVQDALGASRSRSEVARVC